jgi:tricorn protease
VKSGDVLQVTRSSTWDVRWPSSDNKSKIVYELNGELQVFDVTSKEDKIISITVPDDGLARRPSRYSAAKNIEDFELSPKGERALFVARGDVFTAPIEKGPTRNLTNTSNAHDKWARWSPDGSKIAFISDMSGEEQIYLIDQKGESKPVQLTTQFGSMLLPVEWAPDGKRMAVSNKDGKLYAINVANKNVKEIADHEFGEIHYYTWSSDGSHLAFSMRDWNGYWSIYIWSVSDGKVRRITGEYFNEYAPAWGPDGNYLYYLADRQFAPLISTWEWNFAGNRETGIYAMALRKDVKHPFPPESDEVTMGEKKDEEKDKKDKKDEKKKKSVKIDFDGTSKRVTRVSIEDDNMRGLSVVDGYILFLKLGAGFYGRESYIKPSLQIYSIKDRELSTLVDEVENYALSADGKKVLVKQKNAYNLYDVKPKVNEKKTVPTNGLMVDRVPAEEWAEIFEETWRRFRDFFYVCRVECRSCLYCRWRFSNTTQTKSCTSRGSFYS